MVCGLYPWEDTRGKVENNYRGQDNFVGIFAYIFGETGLQWGIQPIFFVSRSPHKHTVGVFRAKIPEPDRDFPTMSLIRGRLHLR